MLKLAEIKNQIQLAEILSVTLLLDAKLFWMNSAQVLTRVLRYGLSARRKPSKIRKYILVEQQNVNPQEKLLYVLTFILIVPILKLLRWLWQITQQIIIISV